MWRAACATSRSRWLLKNAPVPTASALARLTGLPVATDPRLQGRNFGALRGRPWSTLDFDPTELVDAPEGGESMADFHARAAEAWALASARRAALDGLLVVVSHGLLIHAVLQRHAHWPGGTPVLPHRLANTSVSIVDAAPPHAVQVVDCTRHLDDDTGSSPTGGAA